MNKFLLVILDTCWADEFDVNGLWVTTQDEYNEFLEQLDKVNFHGQEIYFGTNEWVEYESKEDLLRDLTTWEISEIFYDEFISIFGGDSHGIIDIPYLIERLVNEEEEYKEEEEEE